MSVAECFVSFPLKDIIRTDTAPHKVSGFLLVFHLFVTPHNKVCVCVWGGGGGYTGITVHLSNIQPFVTKLGVLVHHRELECNAKLV